MNASGKKFAKESLPNEYFHGFHAGNVGDVWKHVVLLSVLEDLIGVSAALQVVDCYAGAGGYRLSGAGEWSEGIAALSKASSSPQDPAVERYLKLVLHRFSAEHFYSGSPLLIEALLRAQDKLRCFETNSEACRQLISQVSPKTEVVDGDGLGGLLDAVRSAARDNTSLFALIDPPWVKKEDWQSIPRAVVEAWKIRPQATLLLWYPIKSYTRVNAMIKTFEVAGLPAAVLDLITTPLEQQKNRLNGSGLILVNPRQRVLEEIARAGIRIGSACATYKSYWALRISHLPR